MDLKEVTLTTDFVKDKIEDHIGESNKYKCETLVNRSRTSENGLSNDSLAIITKPVINRFRTSSTNSLFLAELTEKKKRDEARKENKKFFDEERNVSQSKILNSSRKLSDFEKDEIAFSPPSK